MINFSFNSEVTQIAIVPRVTRLLGSAPLQLLHQHLAAPSQSIANLPKGAAATQRPIPILQEKRETLSMKTSSAE